MADERKPKPTIIDEIHRIDAEVIKMQKALIFLQGQRAALISVADNLISMVVVDAPIEPTVAGTITPIGA